jgi:UDP-N-acetyl-D-mannosaminouronate:lipid I N-acetyl-D-mannosaminouronosyltransferase
MPESRIINGVKIYGFTSKEQLIDYVFDKKGILVAINAEKIYHATDETRRIINDNIGYSDGIGAVKALKKKGIKDAVKIPGCELWLDIISRAYIKNSFYFVGGTEETINNTISKLKADFGGIKILGYRNGYIKTEEERNLLIQDIINKKPDFVFVAMGSPKQEYLMQDIEKNHKAVYQGLGGSFDVYVGKVERAPKWWVRHNLEWAYRLLKQPSRFKRQITLIKFLFLLKIGKL